MKLFFIGLLLLSVNALAQQVSSLPVRDFEKRINGKEVQLLDVRKPEEYKTGHLAGAFQADWTDAKQFKERLQYLNKNKPVYIYCLSGGRSSAAASWLAENGFTNIINMEGGINAWKKEGKKVEVNNVVMQMNNAEYKQLINSGSVVLVDFGAEWCPPCKAMEPVLQTLENEHTNLKLVKIDAGVQTILMKQYKVEGLPFFILYKNGEEVWRHEGVAEKEVFEKAIKGLTPVI
jgi:rhodanese-related sulfurtransferase